MTNYLELAETTKEVLRSASFVPMYLIVGYKTYYYLVAQYRNSFQFHWFPTTADVVMPPIIMLYGLIVVIDVECEYRFFVAASPQSITKYPQEPKNEGQL